MSIKLGASSVSSGVNDPTVTYTPSIKTWTSTLGFGAVPTGLVIAICFTILSPTLSKNHVPSVN